MPVRACSLRSQLDVADALQAEVDLGLAVDIAAAELPDAGIRLAQVLVVIDEVLEVHRAHLLLTLDDELHVQRQLALGLLPGVDRRKTCRDIALVVGDTPGIDPTIPDLAGPRVARPLIQRVRRLDIIVVVEAKRLVGCALLLAVDNRIATARIDLLRGEAEVREVLLDHAGHLGHADALRGDAGLAEHALQRGNVLVPVVLDVLIHVLE